MSFRRSTKEAQREHLHTRVFDAPRERVFEAWVEPEQLAKWWGPKGFTNPVVEMDVRPEGKIRVDMRGPDGVVYPMGGRFEEVIEPARLVLVTTAMEDDEGNPGLEVRNTITFEDLGGRTRVTSRGVVTRVARKAEQALAGMDEGWSQQQERLAQYLEGSEDVYGG